jgi:hypothetical protein
VLGTAGSVVLTAARWKSKAKSSSGDTSGEGLLEDDAFESGDAQVESIMGIGNVVIEAPLSPAQKFKAEKDARSPM